MQTPSSFNLRRWHKRDARGNNTTQNDNVLEMNSSPLPLVLPRSNPLRSLDGELIARQSEGSSGEHVSFGSPAADHSPLRIKHGIEAQRQTWQDLGQQAAKRRRSELTQRTYAYNSGPNRNGLPAKGNNQFGRAGKWRCLACRARRIKVGLPLELTYSQCVVQEGRRCEFCKSREIALCVMTRGPKAPAFNTSGNRNIPRAPSASLDDDLPETEKRMLEFVCSTGFSGKNWSTRGLYRLVLAAFGRTIERSFPLRHAILSYIAFLELPYDTRNEGLVKIHSFRAIQELRRKVTSPDSGDLCASYLLAFMAPWNSSEAKIHTTGGLNIHRYLCETDPEDFIFKALGNFILDRLNEYSELEDLMNDPDPARVARPIQLQSLDKRVENVRLLSTKEWPPLELSAAEILWDHFFLLDRFLIDTVRNQSHYYHWRAPLLENLLSAIKTQLFSSVRLMNSLIRTEELFGVV